MAESDNILTKLQDLLVYLIPQLNMFPRGFTGQRSNCAKGLEHPITEVEPAQWREGSVAVEFQLEFEQLEQPGQHLDRQRSDAHHHRLRRQRPATVLPVGALALRILQSGATTENLIVVVR
jgi:hypothetical protein